jgi:hypothetical protein
LPMLSISAISPSSYDVRGMFVTALLQHVRHVILAGLLVAPALPAVSQEPATPATIATVEQVYEGRDAWIGRFVQITGKVARWGRPNSFILEDNFGGGIEVIVVGPLPKREAEVVVKGIVAIDGMRNPYLNALSVAPPREKADASTPPPDADGDGVQDAADQCPGTRPGTEIDSSGCAVDFISRLKKNPVILVAIAGGILLAVGLFLALRRPAQAAPMPLGVPVGGAPAGAPAGMAVPAGVDEGKTIRIARPDESQGTLQILPGRLEICSGPDAGQVADIRFVRDRTAGSPIPEITFGRHGQASPTHIVLKSPTVSRLHAKFRYEAGRWSVINYSETNPVLVNKRPMSTTESPVPLSDKDVIEMGEVGFRYHA